MRRPSAAGNLDGRNEEGGGVVEGAQKNWRRLDGRNLLPKLIQGVKFTDGIETVRQDAQTAAA